MKFGPGDLVTIKSLSRYSPYSRDLREIGGMGVVINVSEERNSAGGCLYWYDVLISGQIVENIIEMRVKEYVV